MSSRVSNIGVGLKSNSSIILSMDILGKKYSLEFGDISSWKFINSLMKSGNIKNIKHFI